VQAMTRSMNPSWWLRRWSEVCPDKHAIVCGEQAVTYAELQREVTRTACWLQEVGIEKGDRLAVVLENCPEFLFLFLACARLGAVFVPLNYRLSADELDYLLSHSRPRVLVCSSRFADVIRRLDFTSYRPVFTAAYVGDTPPVAEAGLNFGEAIGACSADRTKVASLLSPSSPEDPQVIMYTSGTTGRPKGAVLSHRKTFFNCLNADIFFQLAFDDRMLIVLPMFHSGGLFIQACPCLYKGATIYLHDHFDPVRALQDIRRHAVTKFQGVPTVYRALLHAAAETGADLSSLRICAIGGEKVTSEIIAACLQKGLPLRQIMGQTETSILLWASTDDLLAKPGTVGRPVFHADVAVFDGGGQILNAPAVGELGVRGSILMTEYWHDPEQTGKALRGEWLMTGDVAHQDEDGYFFLVDRAKDMYISGGENVYPAEVERVIGSCPGVLQAAVIGVADERWGEVGHAFVIPDDSRITEVELLAYCGERLARYKLPRYVTFCSDLPRTALGKVQKFKLREMRQTASAAGAELPKPGPRTDLSGTLLDT